MINNDSFYLFIVMYNSMKISREQFLSSHFLKVAVTDFQKNYLHHSRFVMEVITDRNKQIIKKKYSQLKHFSEQVQSKLGIKDFALESHMRNSKREEEVENLLKKLNIIYLVTKENATEQQIYVKTQMRTFVYNLFFNSFDQTNSSDQETKGTIKDISKTSPVKEKSEVQKQVKKEKQQKKEGKFPNVIRNIFKPKREVEDSRKKQFMQSVKSLWLSQSKGWNEKGFTVTDDHLIMFDKGQPLFKQVYFLKYLDCSFIEQDYYRLKLFNPLLNKQILIRFSSIDDVEMDQAQQDLYNNFFVILKSTCFREETTAFNFIGVLISNKKNKFVLETEKRPAQKLTLKLNHSDENTIISLPIDSSVFLHLPILNNYGSYELQVIEEKESALINLGDKSISMSLPVQNMYDQIFNDKPKRKNPDMRNLILQSKQCNYSIRLEYFQLTNYQSYFMGSQSDRYQGNQKPVQFSRDQFRIQKNRLKRILYSIQRWVNYFKGLKNFEYPLQSTVFYVISFLIIVNFDANDIFLYILGLLCLVLIYTHPTTYSFVKDFIVYFFSSQFAKNLQSNLQTRSWRPKFKIHSKKSEEKKKFLEKFNMRTKKKRNILEKYNRLQQILLRGQLYLTDFVSLTEKIKNLFTWYHHKKTKLLFFTLLAAFFGLFFFSFRFMCILLLFKTYAKGKGYYDRVQEMNRIIVYSLFKIIVQEENLTSIREHLEDPSKLIDKRTSQYNSFEKKAKEYLSDVLCIEFDPAIFVQGRSMMQFVACLGEYKQRYTISEDFCKKYSLNIQWSENRSTTTKILMAIYQLFLNVPSDRNILQIKQQSEGDRIEEDSDDDYD